MGMVNSCLLFSLFMLILGYKVKLFVHFCQLNCYSLFKLLFKSWQLAESHLYYLKRY